MKGHRTWSKAGAAAPAALIVAALALVSCGRPVLKVALLTKLEAGSVVGASEVNAATLFLEDRAARRSGAGGGARDGGAAGRPARDMEIVPFDDGWDPDKAVAAYGKARAEGFSFFVTSHTSTCAVRLAEPMRRDGVLAMVTGSTTTLLSGKDDLILRDVPDLRFEQEAIARYVAGLPGRDVLVILDLDNEAYTLPALEAFKAALGSGKRVSEERIRMSALDIERIRSVISSTPYDTLYVLVGAYQATAGSFAQLSMAAKPAARVVFTPWLNSPALAATAGPALAVSTLPSHYPPKGSSPEVDAYIARFKARFGYAPTLISLNVYKALEVLAAAWDSGAATPEACKLWIVGKGRVPTSLGEALFDAAGDSSSPFYMIENPVAELR